MTLLERWKRAVSFWQISRQMAAAKCKERASWVWHHRTKTAGALIAGAGAFKEWALSHPTIHLPGEGRLLMAAGGLVVVIGAYNTIANIFGWEDDPT